MNAEQVLFEIVVVGEGLRTQCTDKVAHFQVNAVHVSTEAGFVVENFATHITVEVEGA